MIEFIKSLPTSQFAEWLDFVANTSIIVAVVTWFVDRMPKKFKLKSTGKTYKIRRKDFNVQAVTNEISRAEANGGMLDPVVREEIIRITQSNHFRVCDEKNNAAETIEALETHE